MSSCFKYPEKCKCGNLVKNATRCNVCISKSYHSLKTENPEKYAKRLKKQREYTAEYRRKNPLKVWLTTIKSRAKIKGLEFNLTLEDFKIPEKCPILGLTLDKTFGVGKKDNTPSIDKVDCTKGYTKDNICIVSWKANKMKSNMTLEEIKSMYNYILEHTKDV